GGPRDKRSPIRPDRDRGVSAVQAAVHETVAPDGGERPWAGDVAVGRPGRDLEQQLICLRLDPADDETPSRVECERDLHRRRAERRWWPPIAGRRAPKSQLHRAVAAVGYDRERGAAARRDRNTCLIRVVADLETLGLAERAVAGSAGRVDVGVPVGPED